MLRTTLLVKLCLLLFIPTSLGQRLLPIGEGVPDGRVYDLEDFGGELIIAGQYLSFNDHSRRNIQGWDGIAHNDLAGAFEAAPSQVRSLVQHEGFLVAGGVEATFNNVTRWNGSAWLTMGSGFQERVNDLIVWNGVLYAGGLFDGVHAWNGLDWAPLGGTAIGQIMSMAVFQNELYVGGLAPPYLFHWSNGTWEPALGGLNGAVHDLVSSGNELFIASASTGTANGAALSPYLCKLNGSGYQNVSFHLSGTPIVSLTGGQVNGVIVSAGESWETARSFLVTTNHQNEIKLPIAFASVGYEGEFYVAGFGNGDSYGPMAGIGRLLNGLCEAYLDVNWARAYVSPSSGFHLNDYENRPGYEVYADDGTESIYCVNPWFSAISGDTLFAQRQVFGIDDLTAGPVNNGLNDAYHDRCFQVWKLNRHEIEWHQTHYDEPGYAPPPAITTWPGNGNTSNGEPDLLAPFADENGNGIYEPALGDFPLIRGDQAIFYILSDAGSAGPLGSEPGLELHVMHYAFGNSWDGFLSGTTFTNVKYINRTQRHYSDVAVGIFADWDIGNYHDDLVGCDTALHMMYGYNRFPVDTSSTISGTYGNYPPAQGAVFLSDPLRAHVNTSSNTPTLNGELYNQMRGRRNNGAPILDMNGGTTTFEFHGDPNSPGQWSALGTAYVGTDDVRASGSTWLPGLMAGDTLCLDIAFIFAKDSVNGHLGSVAQLKQRAAELRAWFQDESIQCSTSYGIGTTVLSSERQGLELWIGPNPASDVMNAWINTDEKITGVTIHSAIGSFVQYERTADTGSTITFDVSRFADGLYILEVSTVNDVRRRRFVVER